MELLIRPQHRKPHYLIILHLSKNLELDNIINKFFGSSETIFLRRNKEEFITLKEIYKLFNQISSLRELRFVHQQYIT